MLAPPRCSYPSLLIVPRTIGDESLLRLARTHRENRFPVVTWRHPNTKAVLLRASRLTSKGVFGMLKSAGHQTSAAAGTMAASACTRLSEHDRSP